VRRFGAIFLILSTLCSAGAAHAQTEAARVRGISISGATQIEEASLRQILGVHSGDRYDPEQCKRIQERIKHRYIRLGYLNAKVTCELSSTDRLRETLIIRVEEGRPLVVREITLPADLPEEIHSFVKPVIKEIRGAVLSDKSRRDFARRILFSLRAQGYVFASVKIDTSYDAISVDITPHQRAELQLQGNDAIPSRELVSLLKLDQRLSPFTRRSLEHLRVLMQDYYEQQGYFLAGVSFEQIRGESEPEIYRYNFDERTKMYLDSVEFTGNTAFTNKELRKVLSVQPRGKWILREFRPGILSRKQIAGDLVALEELYKSKGFLDATIAADPQIDAEGERIRLQLNVVEGEQYLVREIEELHDCPAAAGIQEELLKLRRQPVSDEKFRAIKDTALTELRKKGYAVATVTLTYEKAAQTLAAQTTCGPLVRIGEITVLGLEHTSTDFVKRLLQLKRGDLYDLAALRAAEKRLAQTGVFSQSSIVPADGVIDSDVENLTIQLRERDTGVLDGTVSFNTEDGLRFGGELSQRNLAGEGNTVGFVADLFVNDGPKLFDAGRARAFFKVPGVFGWEGTDLYTEAYAQYDVQNVNEFSFTRIGLDAQLRRTMGDFALSFGTSTFEDELSDVNADVILGPNDIGATYFGYLTAKLEYDRRDSPFAPTDGYYGALSLKGASPLLGSEVDLLISTLELRDYIAVGDDLVWANSLRGTAIVPFSEAEVVPLSQRLFLGGNRTLRGFRRNSLSPIGLAGSRAGGDQSLVFNSELQLNLPANVQLAGFVDAGEVRLVNEGSTLKETSSGFRVAPGVGIRYRTPVGPLGVDLGFPLNRRDDESPVRLYFGFNGVF